MIVESLKDEREDLEDYVQYLCALECGADAIISRDKNGYKDCEIPVVTPEQLLRELA